VDGVTLTAFFFAIVLPQLAKCTEPVAADLQIVRTGLARLLLERVQNVDRFGLRRDVEDPVRIANMNSDLTDARSDVCIGFQSFGSRPCWTRHSWKPASRRVQGQETPASHAASCRAR
jgi:hypothetical protein